jgi:hypothetical protein
VDITTQLSGTETSHVIAADSTSSREVTVTATATGVSNSSKKTQNSIPVSVVVGIVVGIVAGILIGGIAVYLCLQKRKAGAPAEQSQADESATTGVGVQPVDPASKLGVVQWIPQPVSDIYPTAVSNPPPQYRTQVPSNSADNSLATKQPTASGCYLSELPQPTTHSHAELPAGMETTAEMR